MTQANPRPARIEHVNITVPDSERAAQIFEKIFGWHVRWRGKAGNRQVELQTTLRAR